jgi:hypothetical protein
VGFLLDFETKWRSLPIKFAPQMKKSSFTSLVLTGLTAISLVCYLYLNTAASNANETVSRANHIAETELEQAPSETILLPDISLVKKLLNVTKIVLPRD